MGSTLHNPIQYISIQIALFLSLTTRRRRGAHVSLQLIPPLPRRPSSRERARSAAHAAWRSCGRARRSAAVRPPRVGRDSGDPGPCGSCSPSRARPEVRAGGGERPRPRVPGSSCVGQRVRGGMLPVRSRPSLRLPAPPSSPRGAAGRGYAHRSTAAGTPAGPWRLHPSPSLPPGSRWLGPAPPAALTRLLRRVPHWPGLRAARNCVLAGHLLSPSAF